MRQLVNATLLTGLCTLGFSAQAFAWSDHASLLWPLIRTLPALTDTTVPAEPLEAFIVSESEAIAALLAEHEVQARARIPHYPPRPDALALNAGAEDPKRAFLRAIRVNPTLEYSLFIQANPESALPRDSASLGFTDLSFLSGGVSTVTIHYRPLTAGEPVVIADVLATANDEPDFGMDIGLFADNGTPYGMAYGFGEQPFGNPNLDYSSQAPFHMGFYHLDWLTRTLQPQLLRTLPEWRISLYQALGELAFAKGHDYWGWRFMGWALHYIGDLSQPYHADPLPGLGTLEIIWKLVSGQSEAAIQLVSNRHGVIESYQYQRVIGALAAGDWQDPILATIATPAAPVNFTTDTVRKSLTRESAAAGAALDEALETYAPHQFVSDPGFEWVGSGEEPLIVTRVRQGGGDVAVDAMDTALNVQMARFANYAAGWIALALEASHRAP